jgi:hypothetical protein
VRVAGIGGDLLDERGEKGVERSKVDATGGQAGDGAGAGGAQQNQLATLHRAMHPPAKPRLRLNVVFQVRHFRLMFQVFHLNVAKVDLGCCICCSDNIHMLQAYVFMCFSCFKSMFQVFHHDVAEVYLDVA